MEFGRIKIPDEYIELSEEEKNRILDKIIDLTIRIIDKELIFQPEINRVDYLNYSLDFMLDYQEKQENYEYCRIIVDIKKRLNED